MIGAAHLIALYQMKRAAGWILWGVHIHVHRAAKKQRAIRLRAIGRTEARHAATELECGGKKEMRQRGLGSWGGRGRRNEEMEGVAAFRRMSELGDALCQIKTFNLDVNNMLFRI